MVFGGFRSLHVLVTTSHMMLLKKLDLVSLKAGRLLDILTVVHKSLLGTMPAYVSSLFQY